MSVGGDGRSLFLFWSEALVSGAVFVRVVKLCEVSDDGLVIESAYLASVNVCGGAQIPWGESEVDSWNADALMEYMNLQADQRMSSGLHEVANEVARGVCS